MNYLSDAEIKKIIQDNKMLDKRYIRKAINTVSGDVLSRDKARKPLSLFIKKWSKTHSDVTKNKMLRDAGVRQENRPKFRQAISGGAAMTPSEKRKLEQKRVRQIKRNIYESTKSAGSGDSGDYSELVGQRVGAEGKVRRSFYSAPAKKYSHLAMTNNASAHASSSGVSRPSLGNRNNAKQLSVDNKAQSVAGGFGVKGSSAGTGQSTVIRPLGMGGLR